MKKLTLPTAQELSSLNGTIIITSVTPETIFQKPCYRSEYGQVLDIAKIENAYHWYIGGCGKLVVHATL